MTAQHFFLYLGTGFTFPPGSPDLPGFHLIDMYMSGTEQTVQYAIVHLFVPSQHFVWCGHNCFRYGSGLSLMFAK